MAWDTGVHEAEVKHFLRKSAVSLFHPRRFPAIASCCRRRARPSVSGAARAERAPRWLPAAL
jgi:hypothetical protein